MRKFIAIASAALSAVPHDASANSSVITDARMKAAADSDAQYSSVMTAPLNVNARNMFAGHRSHASHSSHSSHYSSSGGGSSYTPSTYVPYTSPAPAPTPAPNPIPRSSLLPAGSTAITPNAYAPSGGTGPRATQDQLKLMIMRVQAALYSRGFDPGAIDGELTPATKAALRAFQAKHGIAVTGTMSTPTLNALGVAL